MYNRKDVHTYFIHMYNRKDVHTYFIHMYNRKDVHTYFIHMYNRKDVHTYYIHMYNRKDVHTYYIHMYNRKDVHTYFIHMYINQSCFPRICRALFYLLYNVKTNCFSLQYSNILHFTFLFSLRNFDPYNIFLVTDRSIYCHMTLSAMNYLLFICIFFLDETMLKSGLSQRPVLCYMFMEYKLY